MVRVVKNDLAGRLRTQSVNDTVMQSGIFHSMHSLDCIIMSVLLCNALGQAAFYALGHGRLLETNIRMAAAQPLILHKRR